MAASRRHHRPPAPELRAPPPSPDAGLGDHAEDLQYYDDDDDDELTRFLKRTRPVPKLTLPHRIFPRDTEAWKPQAIDFEQLIASQRGDGSAAEILRSAAETFGCLQIVNHGVPLHLTAAAESAFRIPPERKAAAAMSPERQWGFELGDNEELFLWHGSDMGDKKEEEMARIWPENYKDSCARLECFYVKVEKIARKIEEILSEPDDSSQTSKSRGEEVACGSRVCFHRHGKSGGKVGAKNELLVMLMRSWSCSCALSLHFCPGAPQFHVYSKRGLVRFPPSSDAMVVTIGDQLEARSGGLYKHVGGRPVFEDGDHHDSVSIAFHYSSTSSSRRPAAGEKIITVTEQVMIAAWLALVYHIILVIFYGRI